jgi:sugar lactone lactonase YvrE
MTDFEVLHDAHATVGEGPLWDGRSGVLRWVDTPQGRLHAFDPASGDRTAIDVGTDLGSVVPHVDGGLVLALRGRVARYDGATGQLTTIAEVEADRPTRYLNDAGIDPAGRLWVGCIDDRELPGSSSFYRVTDATATSVLTGLTLANGIAWSPDGATMYCVDSLAHTVFAFDYEAGTGDARLRTLLWAGTERDGLPDGIAVDAHGDVWVAFWGGGCVRRLSPTGTVRDRIDLPVSQVSSCAFGGDDLQDLYITTAAYGLSTGDLAEQPLAGALLRVRVDTPGLPVPEFSR